MEQPPELIGSIYECAMLPELWPGVLDRLATLAGARGGLLFTANSSVVNWTSSEVLRGGMMRFVSSDLLVRGQRGNRLIAARHAGFLRDLDLYADEANLAQDPMYRDLLWPAGLGWAAGTALQVPTGDSLFLTVERDRARPDREPRAIEHLDALRPHLARSALLSARLQLERARVASETLALLGLAAIVIDGAGKVVAANTLAETLGDRIRWRARNRVSLNDAAADALFQQAIVQLDADAGGAPRSFAIRKTDTLPGMIAHLVPIRGTARDLFVRCAAILVLTPVAMPQAPPVELMQSLFDLTPAEARVARNLVSGDTVDDIAAQGGVSSHTVRTQVRGILGKTGCRRQTDVVALLSGI